MNIRKEYKYLIPIDYLESFRQEIIPYVYADKYTHDQGKSSYSVRSIYFDTGKMNYYHEKLAGLELRKKFRIRGYENTGKNSIIFLEIKRKENEFIAKNRASLYYYNLHDFILTGNSQKFIHQNGNAEEAIKSANTFLYYLNKKYLVPIVLVIYDREAYYSKYNSDLRITIDKNIKSKVCTSMANLFTTHKSIHCLNGYFVLEVKFIFGYPLWLKRIFKKFNLNRKAVSKYCLSVDKHKSEIEMLFRHSSIEFSQSIFDRKCLLFQEVLTN